MNLWLVDGTIFVIADGIAGALFLSGGKDARLMSENFVSEFKPRVISEEEVKAIEASNIKLVYTENDSRIL